MIAAMGVLAILFLVAVVVALMFGIIERITDRDFFVPGVTMVITAGLFAAALAVLALIQWAVAS